MVRNNFKRLRLMMYKIVTYDFIYRMKVIMLIHIYIVYFVGDKTFSFLFYFHDSLNMLILYEQPNVVRQLLY